METNINTANTGMLIRKPITEVFDAFINPDVTTKFWFTHSSGKLKEGAKQTWTWEMYNLNVPISVLKIEEHKTIHIEWGENEHKSAVKWEFKSLDKDRTYVTIENYDFQGKGNDLIYQVIDSTGGFTMVLAGLKAWLEHGVVLNLIGDKLPKDLMDISK